VTAEGRRDAALEELAQADDELAAAGHLLDAGFVRVAQTRIYFAVFHAIRARLYADGIEPRTHEGTQRLFNLHYVKTGRYSVESSRLLSRLQKYREQADYARSFVADPAPARIDQEAARALVERVATPESSISASPSCLRVRAPARSCNHAGTVESRA
jgi:uncharacterized protein (UPF0332 family)